MYDQLNNKIEENKIAELYDAMANEYDDLQDLWYSWLFSRLHYFIVKFLYKKSVPNQAKCLDIGCGTGFQSYLYAMCGNEVEGIDISKDLIDVAIQKDSHNFLQNNLFTSPFKFVNTYKDRIINFAKLIRGNNNIQKPKFKIASGISLPFENERFDVVNCCGSTLSSIDDYKKALNEMCRVLKKNGLFILEAENKYNMDLIWPFIDLLFFKKIGYEQSFKESFNNIFSKKSKHLKIDFPLSLHNEDVDLPIWLFSSAQLIKEIKNLGIKIYKIKAIHNLTNLLPSVWLDHPNPSKLLILIFKILSKLEEIFGSLPFFRKFGCSIVVFGEKL